MAKRRPKTHAVAQSENTKLRSGGQRKKVTIRDRSTGESREVPWSPELSPRGRGRAVASTARTEDTCPDDCPFNGICYPHNVSAHKSSIFGMAKKYGIENTRAALDKIRGKTPYKAFVRHLVSGDVDNEYMSEANALHADRPDLTGWGYTHDWQRRQPSSAEGWTLNASTEAPEEAAEAIRRGWPTIITSPTDESLEGQYIEGQRVIQCPNQTHHNIGCADCQLCMDPNRNTVVQFTAHGSTKLIGNAIKFKRRLFKSDNPPAFKQPDAPSSTAAETSSVFMGMPAIPGKNDHFKIGTSEG